MPGNRIFRFMPHAGRDADTSRCAAGDRTQSVRGRSAIALAGLFWIGVLSTAQAQSAASREPVSVATAVRTPPVNKVGKVTIDPNLGKRLPASPAVADGPTGTTQGGEAVSSSLAFTGSADSAASLGDNSREWLTRQVAQAQQLAGPALRMEVELGTLDPRLRLAPCARIEPYLPANARLWGRARVGLRCVDGPVRWNVFLPVTVRAWGPAWVLRNAVVAGQVLAAEDAVQAEVDWASATAPIVADSNAWIGQTASRALPAGQALRDYMIKMPDLVAVGESVRVLVTSGTFEITASGQAMGSAARGQLVRVKLDTGRIVSGTAVSEQTVQIRM